MTNLHPHQGQPVLTAGAEPGSARAAVILIHGRGDSASNILTLHREIFHPEFRYYAPAAAGNSWYPNRFIAPMASNEPYLSSALQALEELQNRIADEGIPPQRTLWVGFSQGACLTLESAFRHPRRYGGLAALSGGMITPPCPAAKWSAGLEGTPTFFGCSDFDPHIPEERVRQSAAFFQQGGGDVTLRIYPGLGHTLCDDEIAEVKAQMTRSLTRG